MAKKFILTDKHIKLMRAMCVDWQGGSSLGAPEINAKRPYGNSSIEADIHELLTGEKDYELTEKQRDEYAALHMQTGLALEILLQLGTVHPGTYISKDDYAREWKLETP